MFSGLSAVGVKVESFFQVCSDCGEIGASLGCFKEGCSNRYHYRCAIKAKCKLIKSTFTVLCPTHSVRHISS